MPVIAGLWGNRNPAFILFEKRSMQIFTKRLFFLLMLVSAEYKTATAQVIDMHMHSYTEKDFWTGKARNGLESSKTANGHLEETIKKMDIHKIKWAVVCGTIESTERYRKADQRFIPAYQDYEDTLMPIQQFEEYILSGKIRVFGEVMAVYKGRTLNDPIYHHI